MIAESLKNFYLEEFEISKGSLYLVNISKEEVLITEFDEFNEMISSNNKTISYNKWIEIKNNFEITG